MEGKDFHCSAMGDISDPPVGANHTTDRGKHPSPTNPTPSPPDPPPLPPPSYPPTSGQKWSIIHQLVNDQQQCVVCHNSDSFHWTDSYPALAQCSLVIVKDQAAADAVKARHNIHRPP